MARLRGTTAQPRADAARAVLFTIGALIATSAVWLRVSYEQPRPNVVIVTLDTTRLDRLSAYGYMSARQPTLDRLAVEGFTFDRAATVAPLTLPAHTSLFTGLLPPHHGVRDNADPPLEARLPTLAETMQSAGYRTAAFVASIVVGPDRGLARGFKHYSGGQWQADRPDLPGQRPANEVVDEAVAWLDQVADQPFLLWAHLYDAHRPYAPPPRYATTGDPYLGEIAFADAELGRLLAAIDARGLRGRTIVVVMADHGESLGDHGERDHGIFVYEDVVRVPMFMRVPGARPRRIDDVVRIVDVMPTLLALAKLPAPASDGRSLVDLLGGRGAAPEPEVYTESLYPMRFGWSGLRSIHDGRFKLIEAPRAELYDLAQDPFETRNLYQQRPQLAAALHARLIAVAGATPDVRPGDTTPASGEQRARLASLGYVAAGPRAGRGADARLPDPKDCIAQQSLSDSSPPGAVVTSSCGARGDVTGAMRPHEAPHGTATPPRASPPAPGVIVR